MTSRASRGVDTTLAVIATLTAAWPVSTLLVEPTWVSRRLLLLVVVVPVSYTHLTLPTNREV